MLVGAGLLLSRYTAFRQLRAAMEPKQNKQPRTRRRVSHLRRGERGVERRGRRLYAVRRERERAHKRFMPKRSRQLARPPRQSLGKHRNKRTLSPPRSLTMKSKGGFRSGKNMDKLISAVQARECLWDKTYRGHRNRFKLERYWNEVAAEVGTTSINCRKRWKNLKDQCRKEIKKNPNESEWPHFLKLKFIHNQFLAEDDEVEGEDTNDETFNGLDESIKRPKLGYTIRKKFLVNKRRTIDLNTHKLIELVQAKDIIWNRQLKGHHNWYKLDESWKEIAAQLGVTRDEARLKWKYIRDQARKECRKQDSEWDLLPKLQFLINQFNEYESTENEAYGQDSFSTDIHDDQDPETHSSYFIEPSNIKDDDFDEFDTKPIIMETDFYDDDDDTAKNSVNPNEQVDKEKDEDVGFFNSLLPHIRKLGPAKKLMLRMKIQELVYNTVYNET